MVKRNLFKVLAMAAMLTGAASCANQGKVLPEGEAGPLTKLTFNASRDMALDLDPDRRDDATRVTLGDDGSIIWSASDRIELFSADGTGYVFSCKSLQEEGRVAVFEGSAALSNQYVALYPAQEGASLEASSRKVTAELPASQDAVAGGFDPSAALALSVSDGDHLAFRNAVAIVSFVVRNTGVTSIRLSASDAEGAPVDMAGRAAISWNGGEPSAEITAGSAEILLKGDFVSGQRYYMVLFPGTYPRLELAFTDSQGRTAHYHNATPLVLERNSNVNLFDMEIPASKWTLPSITASDLVNVPAEGAISEVTEVRLKDAEDWEVAVSFSGCVFSAYWDEEEGGVCYSVAENKTAQERTGSITVTLSRSGNSDIVKQIAVVQEAGSVTPPPVDNSWRKVTSSADLVAGDDYVIAYPSDRVVATDISGSIMGYANATFSDDLSTITALPSSAVILTLGGSAGAWTFTGPSDKLLGCTAVKKLAWGSGTTTWKISVSSSATTIESTNSSYGDLQYNASSPRFTTYTSTQKPVVLYHRGGNAGSASYVTTNPVASDVTSSSARISATYYCKDSAPSSAGFRYGIDASMLNQTATVQVSGKSGSFYADLSGLYSSTTYYYQAYAVEDGVTIAGSVQSFTTSAEGGTPSTGGADYGWPELPAQTDRNRDGIDDNNRDYYYSHTFRADASTIRNFSSCYSKSKIHPVWVAAPMHSSYLGGSGRNDSYRADPNIKCTQSPKFDGYTRGHMIGSSDRTVSVATNKQAFYYSNIGAQTSTGFNTGGGAWNNLEDLVDGYLCADTLYQVVGCIFDTFTDRYGKTVSAKTGTNSVGTFQVPTAWYKVVLRTKSGNTGKDVRNCSASELKCVAFILGHYSNHQHEPSAKDMYTVEYLESLTGLTFFVNVPNAPKSTFTASEWGL